jgi:UV DNA damage repair endonuclease
LNEDSSSNHQAHADYIYEKIDQYGLQIDIELEAKAKEQALLRYRDVLSLA